MRQEFLKERLDALTKKRLEFTSASRDPVYFAHAYEADDDKEVVALLAACLAFGNITAVQSSVRRVLSELGPRPARAVMRISPTQLHRRLGGFVHRIYTAKELVALFSGVRSLLREHTSLGCAFRACLDRHTGLQPALADFASSLRHGAASRPLRHFIPNPLAGSACKRLLLFLRWMVRPADGVDLGLWSLPTSILLMPVDTHVHRIASNLGLTRQKQASWKAAEEITAALRRFDANDPVRYDFALCHLGISKACPSKYSEAACGACSLRPACIRVENSTPARQLAIIQRAGALGWRYDAT